MVVHTRREIRPCAPRARAICVGFFTVGSLPHISRNCDHNLLNAVFGRVSLHGVKDALCRTFQEGTAGTTYPGEGFVLAGRERAAEVATLVQLLVRKGWLARAELKAAPLYRYLARFPPERAAILRKFYEESARRPRHKYKTFLKAELLAKMVDCEMDLVTSRAIQNPDEATTVSLGRWWLSVGDELKRQWAPPGPIVYTSGLNARELGALADTWLSRADWRAIEGDCSRWDGRYLLACASFFIAILILWSVPGYVRDEECRSGFKLDTDLAQFLIGFCRLSGVGQTSCGNSASNVGCAIRGLVVRDPNLDHPFLLLVLGDDMLLLVPGAHPVRPEDIAHGYSSVGHKPTVVETTAHPLGPTFCSGRFFLADVGRVWAPKPGRLLAKGGWMMRFTLTPLQWLACVGHSMRHSSNHVPVVRAIARRYIELAGPADAATLAIYDAERKAAHVPAATGPHECTPEGLLEFCTFYDVTPSQIEELELAIARMNPGDPLDHPVITAILARDLEAPTKPVDAAARCCSDLVDRPADTAPHVDPETWVQPDPDFWPFELKFAAWGADELVKALQTRLRFTCGIHVRSPPNSAQ